MVDICDKCGKPISDDFDKYTDEKNGRLYEFHSECFDVKEDY